MKKMSNQQYYINTSKIKLEVFKYDLGLSIMTVKSMVEIEDLILNVVKKVRGQTLIIEKLIFKHLWFIQRHPKMNILPSKEIDCCSLIDNS